MNKIIFSLTIIFFTNCQTKYLQNAPISFKDIWQKDTCGIHGERDFLARHIYNNQNIVLGRSISYINYHFGKPDTMIIINEADMKSRLFWFSTGSIEIRGEKCGTTVTSFKIFFDKNDKVKSLSYSIH